ncbi:MAG TPA: polyphosphate kinase 2 family protein [Candidatus Dormibacteraeota bacterium]|nr:polyphosphate kinase 2 family protein [Candidatus Dormibacteraeota bacterium]
MAKTSVRELLRANPGDGPSINLADLDPNATPGIKEKKALRKLSKQHEMLFELQDRLWAEQKGSLLVPLQGMDTGGKDGTVKHVMTGMNPTGVDVHAFKAPTAEELRHHFLWRFKRVLPRPGTIGIFNRTYYEDVLVARVKKLVGEETIEKRYGEINRFEQQLTKSGVTVVKFYLHISYEEQKRRLLERLKDPTKHWKFSENDINERSFWDDYTSAYEAALTRCNSKAAPWYIIPANNKWYRDWAVAQILIETLDEMNPQYPMPRLAVARLEKRLTA